MKDSLRSGAGAWLALAVTLALACSEPQVPVAHGWAFARIDAASARELQVDPPAYLDGGRIVHRSRVVGTVADSLPSDSPR